MDIGFVVGLLDFETEFEVLEVEDFEVGVFVIFEIFDYALLVDEVFVEELGELVGRVGE